LFCCAQDFNKAEKEGDETNKKPTFHNRV
jgi:hypothetical protein